MTYRTSTGEAPGQPPFPDRLVLVLILLAFGLCGGSVPDADQVLGMLTRIGL